MDWKEKYLNKVTCRDCMEGMKELPDESVDLIVTDPPYGYSFMGKDWDKAVIPVPYWKECLRVLKTGAFAFVMSAPRQDVLSKIICNLSEAGFEMGFTSLYHCYPSGFPKAGNIGKMVDKRLGVEGEIVGYNSPPGDFHEFGGQNPRPLARKTTTNEQGQTGPSPRLCGDQS